MFKNLKKTDEKGLASPKGTEGGFTLIEILVVIGIIAILAAVVLIAINPARQFAQANDSQRSSNVNAILNAIGQNLADNRGQFTCGTETLPAAYADGVIGTGATADIDLTCLTPAYLPAIPFDPTEGSDEDTKYEVMQDANGRISVRALSQLDLDGDTVFDDYIEVTR